MSYNIHPYTTIIEIADLGSSQEQLLQVIVGYNDVTTFVGCVDDGNKNILPDDDDKSHWKGDGFRKVEGVGNTVVSFFPLVLTGNSYPSVMIDEQEHQLTPGSDKCIAMTMRDNGQNVDFYPSNQSWGYGNQGKWTGAPNGQPMVPYRGKKESLPGSTLYFKLMQGAITSIDQKRQRTIIADCIDYVKDNTRALSEMRATGGGTSLGNYNCGSGEIPANGYDRTWYPCLNVSLDPGNRCEGGTMSGNKYGTCNSAGFGGNHNKGYKVPFSGTYQINCKYGLHQSYSSSGCGAWLKASIFVNNSNQSAFYHQRSYSGTTAWHTENHQVNLNAGDWVSFKTWGHNCSSYNPVWQDVDGIEIEIYPLYTSHNGDPRPKLLIKGTGDDHFDDLSTLCDTWWNAMDHDEIYTWYISRYQHSGNWASGGVGFDWQYNGEKKSTCISYEDSYSDHRKHDIYDTVGGLGIRDRVFWEAADLDCYELVVEVSSIIDCEIEIHEGTAANVALTPTNPQNIKSVGEYRFCLAALMKTGRWRDCSGWNANGSTNYTCGADGSVPGQASYSDAGEDNFFYFAAGGIKILTAKPNAGVLTASCHISKLEIKKMRPEVTTVVEPIYAGNYTYETPIYDWEYLDVLESNKVPLSLTFQVGDLSDITKRTAGFSKTFNIPASSHNEQILGSMIATGSERQNIEWKKGRIRSNGIVVFNGLMRVEQHVTGKGGYYKCHIIEDTIDWSKAIGNKEMCDLVIQTYEPQVKDRETVINSWNQNKPYHFDRAGAMGSGVKYAEDYFWGVASYGEYHRQSLGIDHRHDVFDFHPFLYTRRLVYKIFDSAGYSLDSKFWESITASLLCHPFGSGENYYNTDPNSMVGDGSSHLAHAEHPGGACGGDFKSGGKIPAGGHDRSWWPCLNVSSDVSNNMNGCGVNTFAGASNRGYNVPFSGDYDITIDCFVYMSHNYFSGGANIQARIYINGVADSDLGAGCGTSDHQHGINESKTMYLNQNDIISIKVTGKNFSNLYAVWMDCTEIDVLVFPNANTSPPPQLVNFSKILDCGTKQIDYIQGLTEMFNLQWTADEESKTVYCETYDDFFGSGNELDWSDKLDATSWTDKYIIEELARNVSFEYAEDTSDVGMNGVQAWRDSNGYNVYKSHTQYNDEKFRKEELKLGTEFFARTLRFSTYGTLTNPGIHSPTHPYCPNGHGWGDMAWRGDDGNWNNSPCMAVIWMDGGGHTNGSSAWRPPYVEYPKSDLRILNHYSLLNGRLIDGTGSQAAECATDCVIWYFEESGAKNMTTYPHSNWINDYKKNVGIDPYNLSWGEYDDGMGNVSPGLYQKYWHTAYMKMNGGSALRTCKMNLTPNDIASFDYRDLIHLKIHGVSTYWTVNKIKDYKPNQEGLTTVELLEWKQAVDFAKMSPEVRGGVKGKKKLTGEQIPSKVDKGVNVQTYSAISKREQGGAALDNNSGNISLGGGIALGHGVTANAMQTVVGNYNNPNPQALFQVGSGTSPKNTNTAFEVTSDGEIEVHGGELVVQELDGIVHELVYDDTVSNPTEEDSDATEVKIKKVYLQKNPGSTRIKGVGSGSSSGSGGGSGGGY